MKVAPILSSHPKLRRAQTLIFFSASLFSSHLFGFPAPVVENTADWTWEDVLPSDEVDALNAFKTNCYPDWNWNSDALWQTAPDGLEFTSGTITALEDGEGNVTGYRLDEPVQVLKMIFESAHDEHNNRIISGPIPSDLGDLSALDTLVLQGVTGAIPPELGDLDNLEKLDLAGNELSGQIPLQLGSLGQLKHLDLSSSNLAGPIPTSLGSLGQLVILDLSSNSLDGPIPAQLGNLNQLENLLLSHNNLDGSIPSQLGDLGALVLLYIS
ncbi:MAG: hypothetical protein AAF585_10080, partial [Verrucomicrobiota bacterium]